MAVLTNADLAEIKRTAYSNKSAWTELKTLAWSKQVFSDTLQAAEDWFVNGFTTTPTVSFEAALEAEAGTLTTAQAKWIGKVWFQWRIGQTW
jgi:hypothetical protein